VITDLVLDIFFAPLTWFIGLLPTAVEAQTFWNLSGSAAYWVTNAYHTANYFLPLDWVLGILAWYLGVWALVGLVRWILRFIPGMGG
jgi:hypothetical protein